MSVRVLVIPVAAAAIAAACYWKVSQPHRPQNVPRFAAAARMRAPDFELVDAGRDLGENRTEPSKRVRLKAYLGRHPIVLVFFDGELGADRDPILARVRELHEALERAGVKTFAVSTALPQQNRKATGRGGGFPFPLLSDPSGAVCKEWGRLRIGSDDVLQTLPALFLIDRAGNVPFRDGRPQPEESPEAALDSLLGSARSFRRAIRQISSRPLRDNRVDFG